MKNEIKHPLERYKLIADPTIRQQAIDNFDEEFYNNNKHLDDGSIDDAIHLGFYWFLTSEKTKYWSNIRKRILEGTLELLPEPIEEPTKYISREIADQYQGLFNLISKEHGLTLTISEMDDIVSESLKLASQSEIDQLRTENEKLRECLEYFYNNSRFSNGSTYEHYSAAMQAKTLLNK